MSRFHGKRLQLLLFWASLPPLALLVRAVVGPVWALVTDSPRLPFWDSAKYGLDGLGLAESLWRGDLGSALAQVRGMSVWPPTFPLIEVPAFWLFGHGYSSPRMLVTLLFALALWQIFHTGAALEEKPRALVCGLLAAVAMAASPLCQVFAGLVMLEVPGILLSLLAFAAYCRAQRENARRRAWHWVGLWSLLLLFCKYNYGLIWLTSLALAEARRRAGSWQSLALGAKRLLRTLNWRQPSVVFLACYGLLLSAILLSGGFHFSLGTWRIQATSLGNPVYLLYLFVLGRVLASVLGWGGSGGDWAERWRGLPASDRILIWWILVPLGFWMLEPRHMKDFFAFLENRSSGLSPWSAEALLFYPKAFLEELSPTPWVGWLVLLLALSFLPAVASGCARRRALALMLLVSCAALMTHPYKLPRFVLTTAPFLWLAAAERAAGVACWLFRRRLEWRLPVLGAWTLAVVLCLFTAGLGPDLPALESGFARRTVTQNQVVLMDRLADVVAEAPLETVLLGAWNGLSPSLLEWHLRQRHPEISPRHRPRMARFLASDRDPPAIGEVLEGLPVGARVLVLDALEDSAVREPFQAGTGWLDPVRSKLAGSTAFTLEYESEYAEAGYRLRVYRRD